jgi:hypothetical protein
MKLNNLLNFNDFVKNFQTDFEAKKTKRTETSKDVLGEGKTEETVITEEQSITPEEKIDEKKGECECKEGEECEKCKDCKCKDGKSEEDTVKE